MPDHEVIARLVSIVIALLFIGYMGMIRPLYVSVSIEPEVEYHAGGFVTSDNQKKSWYITRMPIVDGQEMICILQLGFPTTMFENCVSRDYLLSDTKIMKPYPTDEAKYVYFPDEK